MKLINLFALIGLVFSNLALANDDYKKITPTCKVCMEIDNYVVKHNTELSPDERLNLALKVAKAIESISLKTKSATEKRREIYFSINASIHVLDDDFDSETVVRLMDLRTQAPKDFDYVFWRFPIADQKNLAGRMNAFKEDKVRPKAQIPEPKSIEP